MKKLHFQRALPLFLKNSVYSVNKLALPSLYIRWSDLKKMKKCYLKSAGKGTAYMQYKVGTIT